MKPKKIKRKYTKKSITKKLQTKAGNLWKDYCKLRDRVCQLCGGRKVLQVHHVFSRKNKGLFLDVDNGILLCRVCHCRVTWDDAWKETLRRVVVLKKTQATYDRLYEQSLDKTPFLEWKNIAWLESQITIFKEMLK